MQQKMSSGFNEVDWVHLLWKIRRDFVARSFALIAPVHLILHRVSWSYEMIPNAPKHYTTHQNMSLGSNGVDWVRSLWKIPTWLRGTNFGFNCTNSPYFASSFLQLRNDSKCIQTLCNAPKHEFRVQWGLHREKSRRDFLARTFALIAPVPPIFNRVSCSDETIPNAPKTMKRIKTRA